MERSQGMSTKHEAPGTKHQWPAAGRWMSPKEAAVRLGCTTATLRNYVRRGRLRWKPTSMGNLYPEGDLEVLAEAWRVLGRRGGDAAPGIGDRGLGPGGEAPAAQGTGEEGKGEGLRAGPPGPLVEGTSASLADAATGVGR